MPEPRLWTSADVLWQLPLSKQHVDQTHNPANPSFPTPKHFAFSSPLAPELYEG